MMKLNFDKRDGLIPAVVQDWKTNEVLMVAYMTKETLKKTLDTQKMTYFSRSRKKLWIKGETSGHTQIVKEIYIDCDEDTLLFKVEQTGGACHKGYVSCFYRKFKDGDFVNIGEKVFDPRKKYGVKDEKA